MVIGNRAGSVGVGLGKGSDTALAIEKATRDAKRNIIAVPLADTKSIQHESAAKYGASQVVLAPARGRGLVAGGAVRSVLELAGITDVSAKILSRSKNKLNNARAAVAALQKLKGIQPASLRGALHLERKVQGDEAIQRNHGLLRSARNDEI
jgi:small subunit ribosomal protein S5